MSIIRAAIQIEDVSDFPSGAHLLVSQKLHQKLLLPTHSPITLQLGQNKFPCNTHFFSSNSPIIRIRKDIGGELGIPDGIQLNLRYQPGSQILFLGPVFGVLISNLIKTPDGIFGPASSFCKEIVQAAKARGVLAYIFTLEDTNLETGTVKGWFYRNGDWAQSSLPFPDVVYNRLAYRKQENAPDMQKFFNAIKEKNVILFNEHFLNKWQVHKALSALPQAQTYLPSTQLYRGFSTIKEALDRYHSVYLKPTNGSLGKGIYRVAKFGNRYTCQYSTMSGSVVKSFSKLSDLYLSIVPRISKIPYLVQQGLNLIKINDNPVDFRSLVQKDIRGKWAVTSIVGRIGQDQSIVSNLARGGTIMPVGQALTLASPWFTTSSPTTAYLKKVSTSLAQFLEDSIPGHFAELGIDLAVDVNGKVWLLEINAKPSKNDNETLKERKTRPSVRKLLEYVVYLKGIVGRRNLSSKGAKKTDKKLKRKKR